MAAILPMEVVQCVASSSFRLVMGSPIGEITTRLQTTLSQCSDDEELLHRLMPLAAVLPAANTDSATPEIEPNTLAWALYATMQNLSDLPVDIVGISDLLGTARLKFENTILKGSQPPPILSGVFAVPRPYDVSPELVERQMVNTLRMTVLGALHDANNALTVITTNIMDAKAQSSNLTDLVDRNVHHLPANVAPLVPQYAGAIAKNVRKIDDLLTQTVLLISRVQALLGLPKRSKTDLTEIPGLFDEGGFMHRIGGTLEGIEAELNQSKAELHGIFELSKTHGHFIPPEAFAEGMSLLRSLQECFGVFQDLVNLIRELFNLLQDVVKGINQDPGPILLNDQLNLLRPRMIGGVMSKGVAVGLDLEPAPWPIWGFPIHISQVLLNLACNARDAMERSGFFLISTRNVTLGPREVEALDAMDSSFLRPAPKPGEYVMLRLQDTGPGIPAHILPLIFDLSVSGKGSSGIGLAVVLQLVRSMGGFIAVETFQDDYQDRPRGTDFSVYFPRSL